MTSSNKDRTDDLYYFESDNLALKGNTDYGEVLKILFILDAQRKTAIKEIHDLLAVLLEWESIPQESIKQLIRSLPRRMQAVIRSRGGVTRY